MEIETEGKLPISRGVSSDGFLLRTGANFHIQSRLEPEGWRYRRWIRRVTDLKIEVFPRVSCRRDRMCSCDMKSDKPHACDLCNKKFALACNLRAHMKTHEGDPQEECTRCGKMYICNGTPDVCPKCRGQNNNAPHGDSAEDSSGNHTEDSNTPE